MKKFNLYLALALAAGLASCSNSDDGIPAYPDVPRSNVVNFAPAKQTVINFTSNDVDIAQNAIVSWTPVTNSSIDRDAEATLCKSVLPEQNGNIDQLNTDFLYYAKDADMELEFYPVYSHTDKMHKLGVFYYDEEGNRHDQIVWDQINPWALTESKWEASGEVKYSKGLKITIKKGYKFGFYWDGSYRPVGENIWNDVETLFYSSSELNPESRCYVNYNYADKTSRIHAGTFVRNGKTYLGIEDWTDFDYQDIVFMCDKEIPTVKADDVKPAPDPVTPDPDPTDPDQPVVPEDPADPEVKANGGSVEVNLALNEEHEKDDWKESHLSVHVRDTTDFTLFMPIEAEYYCPQDDMMIVQKHDTNFVYNETSETLSMVIDGQTVTLDVTFAANGITFQSHGINAKVLKYCRDTYGDGITFEVRNYYNDALSRTDIQRKLNQSTISFTNAPNTYYYAFGYWEGSIDPLACAVKPTDAADRNNVKVEMSEHEGAQLYIYTKK